MYIKTNIRQDKIHSRSLKPSYKHLTPAQKAIVKAEEKADRLSRELDRCWRIAYSQGYDPKHNNQLPILEIIFLSLNELERTQKRRDRLEIKHGLDSDQVMQLYQKTKSRFYGGSF